MRVSTWSLASLVVGAALALAAACQSSSENQGSGPLAVGGAAGGEGVECQANGDCSEDERCLPDGSCGQCWFHSDCQDSYCIEGACVDRTTCSGDTDCTAPASLCSGVTQGECVQCRTNEDCDAGEGCVYGACHSRACEGGTCGTCTADTECAAGEHCVRGHCATDVCGAGKSRCLSASSVVYCDARGSTEIALLCPDEQGCGGELGAELCKAWSCIPGVTECDEAGASVRTCAPDGQGYSEVVDCGESDQVCAEAACKDVICTANTAFCEDGNVRSCNATGTGSSITTTCLTSQYCDADTATCQAKVCTPAALGCDGDQKGVCNELGSGYDDLVACELTESCVLGACEPKICTPLEYSCESDGNPYQCNATGTARDLLSICSTSTYCYASAYDVYCYSDVCTPTSISCTGNATQQCNAAGSGYDLGTDCTATSQNCYAGVCMPPVCTVGTRLCVNGDVHSCANNGTLTSLYTDCTAAQYCDDVTATCKAKVCTPGAPGCVGSVATVCKADGSGWETGGTDCAASGDACEVGVCKDIICTPNEHTCNGALAETCNSLGTAKTLYQNCGTTTSHCYQPVGSNAYCRADVCTQGNPACNGTVATTCNADGSSYVAGGTDCATSGDACVVGACQDIVCTANSKFCGGGSVQQCNANGTAYTQYDFCFANEYCKTQSSLNAICTADSCTTGSLGCAGENYGTCNADGSGYENTTDCAQTAQICGASGCAATVDDAVGGTGDGSLAYWSQIAGNILRADVDRTLTSISQNIGYLAQVQFLVYKSSTLNGPYTPVLSVQGTGTGTTRSSGTISVQLDAGSYYFIGVWSPNTNPTSQYNASIDVPIVRTLGTILGSYVVQADGSPPASFSGPLTSQYAMIQMQTLTTAPPQ